MIGIVLSTTRIFRHWAGTTLISACLLGITAIPAGATANVELKVGVVQRFGNQPTDSLLLKATSGDRLRIDYETMEGRGTLVTDSVEIKVAMKSLPVPMVEERIVLSTHRSFESAEQTAKEWRARGIEVEVAHPDRWQVWAKRDVYNTPLLRRLLLQSLKSAGDLTTYIETEVLRQFPQPYWVVDGFRYNRRWLEISSNKNLIQVQKKTDEPATRLYGGRLRLQPNAYGSYTLVNEVPLETYLRGVVPHEIGARSPNSALEAQAILARTYVLRNLRRFEIDNYQICASPECQVYKGLGETYPNADRAISATRGLVLTYDNELVDALYSSTTGGITAPFTDLWDGPERPYLTAVVDAVGNVWDLSGKSLADEKNFRAFMNLKTGFNEEDWRLFRWREQTSLEEMTKFLQKYLKNRKHPQAGIKKIHRVRVAQRSPAGRVLKMTVQTDLGTIEIEKDQIRNAFWPPISTLFYIDPVYDENKTLKGYVFVGGGFGHGVGMGQIGARKLGKLGWSSERILRFYFRGTQVQPLNNSIVLWRDPSTLPAQ